MQDRRTFVRTVGLVTVGASLAGCPDDDPEPEPEPEPDVDLDPEDRVDEYLTENDANLYDETIDDRTGEEELTIDVGAGDDGLAYDPAAARIDVGTTIVWEWTGRGGRHNVVSEEDIGSDYEFKSGDVIDEEGHTWSYTFEEDGVALYYCEAHRAVGHHGGLIVE